MDLSVGWALLQTLLSSITILKSQTVVLSQVDFVPTAKNYLVQSVSSAEVERP